MRDGAESWGEALEEKRSPRIKRRQEPFPKTRAGAVSTPMAQGLPKGIVGPPHFPILVNEPQTPAELEYLLTPVQRGSPFGAEGWDHDAAQRIGVLSTLEKGSRPLYWALPRK